MSKRNQSKQSRFSENIRKKQDLQKRRMLVSLVRLIVFLAIMTGITLVINRKRQDTKYNSHNKESLQTSNVTAHYRVDINLNNIPDYSGNPVYELNSNIPYFDISQIDVCTDFELYSELDELGRCGTAFANLSKSLMPSGKREQIDMVRPSGWHTVKYPDVIEDRYLYNRCHLIAYSLAGENANELNLITGTRYLNRDGMLPYEILISNYIRRTGNHVLYRVTPVFKGNELVARSVLMEAWSVEDHGRRICFNVFAYNVQHGIFIDYSTGRSRIKGNIFFCNRRSR